MTDNKNFYPRSPCGERRNKRPTGHQLVKHFYPRSPCGERLCHRLHLQEILDISIHALLAESDKSNQSRRGIPCLISIHALLAESDSGAGLLYGAALLFLSTLSLRRATLYLIYFIIAIAFLSTLSLRRATTPNPIMQIPIKKFLSTLSLRRATRGRHSGQ